MARRIVLALSALLLFAPLPAGAADLGELIAPPATCPGQGRLSAPTPIQVEAMHCMTNFARSRAGKPPLTAAHSLDRSAELKSGDMLRCGEFDHEACGRDFAFWMRRVGYLSGGCWRAAENIALGTGSYGTARAIFRSWIHSPGHRRNILGPWRDFGVGLRVGSLDGYHAAHVWTQHFAALC